LAGVCPILTVDINVRSRTNLKIYTDTRETLLNVLEGLLIMLLNKILFIWQLTNRQNCQMDSQRTRIPLIIIM